MKTTSIPLDCSLGMQSGLIEDSSISASSYYKSESWIWLPSRGRLFSQDDYDNHLIGGWCPENNNGQMYLQVRFSNLHFSITSCKFKCVQDAAAMLVQLSESFVNMNQHGVDDVTTHPTPQTNKNTALPIRHRDPSINRCQLIQQITQQFALVFTSYPMAWLYQFFSITIPSITHQEYTLGFWSMKFNLC